MGANTTEELSETVFGPDPNGCPVAPPYVDDLTDIHREPLRVLPKGLSTTGRRGVLSA